MEFHLSGIVRGTSKRYRSSTVWFSWDGVYVFHNSGPSLPLLLSPLSLLPVLRPCTILGYSPKTTRVQPFSLIYPLMLPPLARGCLCACRELFFFQLDSLTNANISSVMLRARGDTHAALYTVTSYRLAVRLLDGFSNFRFRFGA